MVFDFTKKKADFQSVHKALIIYKQLHGHLLVPRSFRISTTDTAYPKTLHGMSLGHIVNGIRRGKTFVAHRTEFENLGFMFEVEKYEVSRIKDALRIYKSLYGNVRIPISYSIGRLEYYYPLHVRGMKIGSILARIRLQGQYEKFRDDFVALGIEFVRMPKRKFDEYM